MNLLNIILSSQNSQKFDLKELIGIAAGVFILASFIPKKEQIIRFINIFGCLFFIIYGAVMPSPLISVIIINSTLLILQVVYLSIYFVNKKKKSANDKNAEIIKQFDALKEYLSNEKLTELNKLKEKVVCILKEQDEIILKLCKKYTNNDKEKKEFN